MQLLMPLLLLPLLLLQPWHRKTPLLELRRKPAPKNVMSSLDCFIVMLLPTSHNKHSHQ